MKKVHIYILVSILLLGLIVFFIFFNKETKYSKNIFYMDTYINVVIYSDKKEAAEQAFTYIDNLYSDYHEMTDRYNEYDGVYNVYNINNDLKIGETKTIDSRLYELIKYGYDYYLTSDGRLNIAMGNVIDIWKKYRDKGEGIPTSSELNLTTDINCLELRDGMISKNCNISLDLGAISKGYTTALAAQYLESVGLNNYLINAGGNVVVGDYYKKNGAYKVGIETPIKNSDNLYKIVNVNNKAVVTSGGYLRYYEYDGKIYHHIIDPNTNFPPENMLSVTVIAEDEKLADLLSTSLFIMTIEDGQKLVDSLSGVEAVWYGNDGKIYESEGFSSYE